MVFKHPLFPNGMGSPSFVLHVSVVLGWIVTRLATPYADSVLQALPGKVPVVPTCWITDTAETLLVAEKRGWINPSRTSSELAILRGYPILFDDETDHQAWGDTLNLARAHGITVPDAAYLEVALRLNLPLATTDPALTSAATSAGAMLFTP